jgi:uncharacterized NAD(P)/FAD-binding protein YdhS
MAFRGKGSLDVLPVGLYPWSMHIGIIGGGFSGCLLAVQLLRRAPAGTAITIIESADVVGRGAAYGTVNPEHLLNVRAGNMGAFPDDPQNFHTWLTANGDPSPASTFLPRMRYGDYVGHILHAAVAERAGKVPVSFVTGVANALHAGARPAVSLEDGRRLTFDRIALCFGNLPPGAPPGLTDAARGSPRYLHDPWKARALEAIPADDDVLIIGSGLTMADVVETLARQKHAGLIAVVSRHGYVPNSHKTAKPMTMDKPTSSLFALFRNFRQAAKAAPSIGQDWRDIIDAFRPWTIETWRRFSLAERRQFLRHIRPLWEVHRHRVAPEVADTLTSLKGSGQLSVSAGRIVSIDWKDQTFAVVIRPRGEAADKKVTARWIVNCTGPQGDYAKTSNPLVRHAVAAGVIRPDPLQLGLDVTDACMVIDANGVASPNIAAVGPPTRGAFWEITSVPDIRRACAQMAETLLKP